MLTIPNALAPSEDEYTIANLLSNASIRNVEQIQQQIVKLLSDVVWITPSNCLHITLMEIICNTDYGNLPRKQLFSDWYRHYSEIAKEIIGQFSDFSLDFNTLEISPSAIIIKASDPGPLNNIRSALLSKTTLPRKTKLPPDIAHSTIARFTKATELERLREIIGSIKVNINEHIESFKLIEGLAPPILDPKEITNYPLNSK
ncbi:MAG TPA: hypothetical protein VLG37_00695 [Candidatus Saccharimonadales bacterium]|nr:hypothetical protein [Candidatus Saccharimonadales bacterium]